MMESERSFTQLISSIGEAKTNEMKLKTKLVFDFFFDHMNRSFNLDDVLHIVGRGD